MVRFMSLSSGSCGNCYFLGTESDGILIDAGVSIRYLKKGLEEKGLGLDSFSAILVTHDHLDHIRNLGSYCKRLKRPIFATQKLHGVLARHSFTADHIGPWRVDLEEEKWNNVCGFMVRYFVVPHDATQTVGFAIMVDDYKFVIMTDIGRMTDEAVAFAAQADTVVVESNYDIDMLMGGDYPHELKMRIVAGDGHLSNDQCASAIVRFLHKGLKNIFLCHLSENNNTPSLALNCAFEAINANCDDFAPELHCMPRSCPSELYYLKP